MAAIFPYELLEKRRRRFKPAVIPKYIEMQDDMKKANKELIERGCKAPSLQCSTIFFHSSLARVSLIWRLLKELQKDF